MARTQVWDSSYEAIPADGAQASEGALRIRNLKRDIRERAEIDHDWDDVTDAGKHLKVSFRDPLGAKPTAVASEGYLYTKDVSSKAELHWEDEDGNELVLTSAGLIPEAALQTKAFFPVGTVMLFVQTAAPTGWTKGATHNDKALRVVTGTPTTGGATAFATVFGAGKTTGSHTLLTAEIPAHTHPEASAGNFVVEVGAGTAQAQTQAGATNVNKVAATGSTGGGGGHTHTESLDLQFVDVIIATKD